MHITTLKHIAVAAGALLLLAACDMHKKEEKVEFGSLTQSLKMIGADGKMYGTVELDPVGQGKLYDYNGKIIGYIVPPQVQ